MQLIVQDSVLPQLITAAIEAYEFKHHGRGKAMLETIGLLWGYVLRFDEERQPRQIVATIATVETSAVRHQNWAMPNYKSIKSKRKFFQEHWPEVELIGTFHTHPYFNLSETKINKGWEASDGNDDGEPGDRQFWPQFHRDICPDMPCLMHLVIAITKLEKAGWAAPRRMKGKHHDYAYVFSSSDKKMWINSYATNLSPRKDTSDDNEYVVDDNANLFVPSLVERFSHDE